jgi:hypothetical protein
MVRTKGPVRAIRSGVGPPPKARLKRGVDRMGGQRPGDPRWIGVELPLPVGGDHVSRRTTRPSQKYSRA